MADNESPTPPRRYDFSVEYDPLVLNPVECYWRDLQPWLEQNGYLLRPRYSPGWIPSWIGTTKKWFECEDGFCVVSACCLFDVLQLMHTTHRGAMSSTPLGYMMVQSFV